MPVAPEQPNGTSPEEQQMASMEQAAAAAAPATPPAEQTPPTPPVQAAAVPPAPPAAPQTPPVEQKQAEPTNEADAKFSYPEGASQAEQAVIDVFKGKGVDPYVMEAIFAKAVASGNSADIDQQKLVETVGETQATLIMGSVAQIVAANSASVAAAQKTATDVFGSMETFNSAKEWAQSLEQRDAAFAAKMNEYRKMVDAGGEAQRLALTAIKEAFVADPNTTKTPELVTGSTTGGFVPIKNNREYFDLLDKARRNRDTEEFARVQNRWRMSQGMK